MKTRMIMTVVATATAMTVGVALGGCGTNDSTPLGSPARPQSVAQAHNQADITFAQDMIPHHAQAIAMAKMATQRASSPQIKDLAVRIQAAQQPEIDQMSRWLRAWNASVPSTDSPMGEMGQMEHGASGAMPGMMSGDQMRQLGKASGEAFDRMFLQVMIDRHQGAITMAKTELSRGQNPDARQLAQRIIDAQQREITKMQALLSM
jgi:uncharacterized protein (DUF305 family)